MGYFVRRILVSLFTLLGVVTVAFLLIQLAPGDPAELMLGDYIGVSPQVIKDLRARLGVDRPLLEQYWKYISSVLRGDLGTSFRYNQPVLGEIVAVLPFTLHLAVAGVLVAVVIGVPAGVYIAVRRNTGSDYVTSALSIVWLSSPSFWLGILFIYFFSYKLGWFPVFGAGKLGDWRSLIMHLILPALAVGLRSAALITRMTRSSMLEVLGQDYVRTAKAKGLADRTVVYKHALRNAAIPITTIVGLDVAYLLGGAIVTETVFARPGLGKMVIDAIYARDYPAVQGAIVVFAAIILLVNLVVDLVYALIDPRIRYS